MNRGDIYVVSLEPTLGREQRGTRPVLVVSALAFNNATKLPVVLPITNGGAFARRNGFAVEILGIGTTGVVRCDQPACSTWMRAAGEKSIHCLQPSWQMSWRDCQRFLLNRPRQFNSELQQSVFGRMFVPWTTASTASA